MTATPAPDLSPAEALRERVARAMQAVDDVVGSPVLPWDDEDTPRAAYLRLADAAIAVLAPTPDSGGEAAVSRVDVLRNGNPVYTLDVTSGSVSIDAMPSRAAVNGDPS